MQRDLAPVWESLPSRHLPVLGERVPTYLPGCPHPGDVNLVACGFSRLSLGCLPGCLASRLPGNDWPLQIIPDSLLVHA